MFYPRQDLARAQPKLLKPIEQVVHVPELNKLLARVLQVAPISKLREFESAAAHPDLLISKAYANNSNEKFESLQYFARCKVKRYVFNPQLNKYFGFSREITCEFGDKKLVVGDWIMIVKKENLRHRLLKYRCAEIVDKVGEIRDENSGEKIFFT